ncbi:OLC1v1019274C1 [Oldenlandia corymbosa var. corymbosa]|uniref:OLC1v1019274C1 n=1 Tax=Oldenlandia corymbosa var. corymbosa TaxID=529605 RepID=A0AAV1EDM5_OLDCO|nr:OLC1v1019274C1 [Oldenlandia corymbosa var. corymbosa]
MSRGTSALFRVALILLALFIASSLTPKTEAADEITNAITNVANILGTVDMNNVGEVAAPLLKDVDGCKLRKTLEDLDAAIQLLASQLPENGNCSINADTINSVVSLAKSLIPAPAAGGN